MCSNMHKHTHTHTHARTHTQTQTCMNQDRNTSQSSSVKSADLRLDLVEFGNESMLDPVHT